MLSIEDEADRRDERPIDPILGVLRAGGAYVPIDPRYPRERQEFIARDAGAKLVLTSLDVTGEAAPRCLDPDNRLRHLHIWFDGNPEGLCGHARKRQFAHGRHARAVRVRRARCLGAVPLLRLRLFGLGVVGRAALRRTRGHRSVRDFARREEFAKLLVRERVTVLNQTPSAFRALIAAASSVCAERVRAAVRDLRRGGARSADAAAVDRTLRRRRAATGQHVRHHRRPCT